MKLLSTLLASLLVVGSNFCQSEETLAGEYKNLVAESNGQVGHLLFHAVSEKTYKFSLKLNRGEPSYNSGHLYGAVTFDSGEATFSTEEFKFENDICELNFRLDSEAIVISTEGDNNKCGFGFGVYADGTYSQVSNINPMKYIDALGNDMNF